MAMEGPGSGTGDHKAWLEFKNLRDFALVGNGVINGKGRRWWSQVCRPTMKVRFLRSLFDSWLCRKVSGKTWCRNRKEFYVNLKD